MEYGTSILFWTFTLKLFPDDILINNYFLGVISGGIIFIASYVLFPVFAGTYPTMIGASAE